MTEFLDWFERHKLGVIGTLALHSVLLFGFTLWQVNMEPTELERNEMRVDVMNDVEAEEVMQQAAKILSEEVIDHIQAQALDAKLRTLLGDTDPFWIRWRYVGEKQGWLA